MGLEDMKKPPLKDAVSGTPATGSAKRIGTPAAISPKAHPEFTNPLFGHPPSAVDLAPIQRQIVLKQEALGALPGPAIGGLSTAGSGYVQQFQGCDIYYSEATGAHEVHGDIRAKYNALGGAAGPLGLPITDETGTPDEPDKPGSAGRFNHFAGGSIYWTQNTGPMMVSGAIRGLWANMGWERGSLSYPVQDEYRMLTSQPDIDPATYWSRFKNGAILCSKDGTAVALPAVMAANDLRTVVRHQFDQQFHASPKNIGLQPQVDTLSISDWSFNESDIFVTYQRKITYRLYGFHDNGALAGDTNFFADVELGFDLAWPDQFGEPPTKTLIVGLYSVSVSANGIAAGDVAQGVADGIYSNFYPANPDPTTPYIPAGWTGVTDIPTGAQADGSNIDVIGILITTTGDLQILVNPLPTNIGNFRQYSAGQKLTAFVESNS